MEVRRPFKVSNLLYCQEVSHLLLSLCSLTKLWPRHHLWNWSPQYDAHCCQGNPADRRESMCSHIMCSTEKPISEASSFELISARNLWLSLFLLWLAQPGSLLHTHIPGFSPGSRFANLNHLYLLPLPHPNLQVLLPLPPSVSLMYLLPIFQRSHLWDLNCHGSFVTGPPTSRLSQFPPAFSSPAGSNHIIPGFNLQLLP